MFIIISGCDRVGKTTLCNELVKRLDAKYIHFSAPRSKELAFHEYIDFIKNADINQIYIIDRFYECEKIYAPIYRNYTQNNCRFLDNLVRLSHKVLFVYVTADINIIEQRILREGDDYISIQDVHNIIKNYEVYMNEIQLPYIICKNNNEENLSNNIADIILYQNMQFQDDIFGNVKGNKAIIFSKLRDIREDNVSNIIINDRLKIEDNIQHNEYIPYENADEYIWKLKPTSDTYNYNEYIFTNNANNIDLLNIDERLLIDVL